MDLGLTDRVYVVTGAGHGVGRACAEQLAAEGARLVLGGDDDESLAKVASELGGADRAIAISGDLADPGLETCLVAAAIARYGRLDGALVDVPQPARAGVAGTPTTATGASASSPRSSGRCGCAAPSRETSPRRAARSCSCSRRRSANRSRGPRSRARCGRRWR